tara:strand:- start:30 stop:557 length:528 start_codon:yes stop_codon:yes gene_type:complete
MHLDFKTIDKRVWENNPKMLKDYGFDKGDELGNPKCYISEYHFGCTNARMRGKLASMGWHVDEWNDNVLVYDIRTIDEARALADKVYDAYDAGRVVSWWQYILFYPYWCWHYTKESREMLRDEWSAWLVPKWADKFWRDEMDFGGDDDVDYNGTYLDIVFDMVEVAHKHSGKIVR